MTDDSPRTTGFIVDHDPDEGSLRDSPPLKSIRPRLRSRSPSPRQCVIKLFPEVHPRQADPTLLHYLDGGRKSKLQLDAAATTPSCSCPSCNGDSDTDDESSSESCDPDESNDTQRQAMTASATLSAPLSAATHGSSNSPGDANISHSNPFDLVSLAAGALTALTGDKSIAAVTRPSPTPQEYGNGGGTQSSRQNWPAAPALPVPTDPPRRSPDLVRETAYRNDRSESSAAPSTVPLPVPESLSPSMSQASAAFHHPRHLGSPSLMSTPMSGPSGELPPLQIDSPRSDVGSHQALPSLRDHLGDIQRLAQATFADVAVDHRSSIPASCSPPTTAITVATSLTRMPDALPGALVTSPVSPSEQCRGDFPSPAPSLAGPSLFNVFYSSNSGLVRPPPPVEHGDKVTQTLTPNSDNSVPPSAAQVGAEPTLADATSQQSIGFKCVHSGCNAPPFQTQYLLNSHANVHSSARPYYCPVQGCARAEGGKGFKRKNEMIRHGLVHESPGYVCPFCPDREHKYPRPDNLQRHVRVHHTDKDKDDPLLRQVLSQRLNGPNRGRRRRNAPL